VIRVVHLRKLGIDCPVHSASGVHSFIEFCDACDAADQPAAAMLRDTEEAK